MNALKLNLHSLLNFQRDSWSIMDICDEQVFDMLSASECLRFDI